jgi:hypothetical protein
VTSSGLTAALAAIHRCKEMIEPGAPRAEALRYAGSVMGTHAEELIGGYPLASGKPLPLFYDRIDAQGHPYKSKFKSMKQQRLVMSLVQRKKIPYARTGNLGRSVTHRAMSTQDSVIVLVGASIHYAVYVYGRATTPRQQSHYHEGTWTPIEETIRTHLDALYKTFERALTGYIAGYVKGKK